MGICLYCLAMVAVSTLVGGLLMYLFTNSGRKKIIDDRDMYHRDADQAKNSLNRITTEYNEYKAKATKRIEDGEVEINKLNKLNLSLSNAPRPKLTQAELDHKYLKWKKRAEDLSNELEYIKAKVNAKETTSGKKDAQILEDVKSQLAKALKKIRQQDLQLMEAKSNVASSTKKKGSGKKKKKIKKLQTELSSLKSKLKKKK